MYMDTKLKTKQIVHKYKKEKKTIPQIEAEMGLNYRTIYRRLKESGVKLRTRKRDNRGKFLPLDNSVEKE